MDSTDLSDNKRIQWQLVFITNFSTVTEKLAFILLFFFLTKFSLSHYLLLETVSFIKQVTALYRLKLVPIEKDFGGQGGRKHFL